MWECKYGKEPLDLKLFTIRVFQKIWILLIGLLIGAILGGGIYYVNKVVMAKGSEYKAESVVYVDFAKDDQGNYYYAFNSIGWSDLVKTDLMVEETLKNMTLEATPEEIKASVAVRPGTDYRMILLDVTNTNPKLAMDIAKGMEQAFLNLGQELRECERIRVITTPESAPLVVVDTHTLRAAFGGALLTGVLTVLALLFWAALDDSLYTAIAFEKRYRLPALGTITKKRQQSYMTELKNNVEWLGTKYKHLGMLTLPEDTVEPKQLDEIVKIIKNTGVIIDAITTETPDREYYNQARSYDGIVLAIRWGESGGAVEQYLSTLIQQDCRVAGAILYDGEDRILNWYAAGFRKTSMQAGAGRTSL